MRVSVVIPVRNNAVGLRLCLQALEKQTFPRQSFEIVVVDNDSTDALGEVKKQFPQARWLFDAGSGSYSARNCGLKEAHGEIVAFTDSDCQPSPEWLVNGVAALDSNEGTIIGGNVEMIDPTDRSLNIYEEIEIVASGLPDSRRLVEERGFTTTGNLMTCRENFDHHGFFDATLKSAGDREWVQRAVAAGEKLIYKENVLVKHPRRSTFYDLKQKYRRQVGGRMVLLKRTKPGLISIINELCLYSLIDPKTYRMAIFHPKIHGFTRRIHFIAALLLMSVVTTTERFKVCLGGDTHRG